MYKLENGRIRLSVRNLVEFILKSGDIDNRRNGQADADAMLEGARIHRKIQKSMGPDYQAEVTLKQQIELEHFTLLLEGRADGIEKKEDRVVIDEIKTVFGSLDQLMEAVPVHLAQAECYAYMYAVQNHLTKISVQITYCQAETEEIRRFRETYSMERIMEIFLSYVREFEKWGNFLIEHRTARQESIQSLEFPFPYRKGQRNLVVAAYKTMIQKEILFIQAPTGIGKTLSTIFPAVMTIGQEKAEKIFYLTAKTVTRTVAEEGFRILRDRGLRLSSVTITAKEKMCVQETMECNPEHCPRAKGHLDRVNAAVYDLITKESDVSREILLHYAEIYQVCPFEMCLDVTYWMDAVICDYNYVFDPNVRLQRYFGSGEATDCLFLVDEAHNLVERAREMYSAVLSKEAFSEAKKQYEGYPKMIRRLNACNRKLLELKRECDDWVLLKEGEGLGALLLELQRLYTDLTEFPVKYPQWHSTKESGEFYFMIRDFLNVYEQLDDHYRVYTRIAEDGSFLIKLFCVNPSKRLSECYAMGKSTILFSATMLPILYYKELLCGKKDAFAIYADSPFDKERRYLAITNDVTSLYTRRSRKEFEKIASYISRMTALKKGNYLVFFPSYSYMNQVMECMEAEEDVELFVQETGMAEEQREEFLGHFAENSEKTNLGFCVMGGVFSEGIDLQGEKLIGVFLVGTGLPQIGLERELLKTYFNEQKKDGFLFAYLYPGMNKVLQAAGRLIRTMDDYGMILLMDYRFLRPEYNSQFPREWDQYDLLQLENCTKNLEQFWKKIEQSNIDR